MFVEFKIDWVIGWVGERFWDSFNFLGRVYGKLIVGFGKINGGLVVIKVVFDSNELLDLIYLN